MTDITMCNDKECPKKETCYRYMATPDGYQSYFKDNPRDIKSQECDEYWDIKERLVNE